MNRFTSFVFMSAKQRRLCQHLADEQPRLQRMAYSWTHDMDIADEIVQETMIKAIKNIDSLKNFKAVDGWMFRVLSNCFYDHCRRQKDTIDIDDCVLVDDHTPDSLNDRDEMLSDVRSAIAQLPVKHRQVITLVDLESLSYLEVAEILQVPIGTVMSRLNRARKNLKELLQDGDHKDKSGKRAELRLVR